MDFRCYRNDQNRGSKNDQSCSCKCASRRGRNRRRERLCRGSIGKIFPFFQSSKFGSAPSAHPDAEQPNNDAAVNSEDKEVEGPKKPKVKRKKGSAPPKGQSCADRMLILKSEKFFKQHRSAPEIVDALAAKGWTHNTNQVGAALTNMFNRGDIQRTKEGGGPWKYFWDRD